jgi:hypothetical protein
MPSLLPGDLVVVRTPGFFAWIIRLGQMLQGKPDLRNHVAMLHHTVNGVNWYLEGRPGGLGWKAFKVTDDAYLNSPWTVTNAAQPKTDGQREAVCAAMRRLFGAPYDWGAIDADAASALRLPDWWAKWGSSSVMPGHVVCSSSAAWAYPQGGLAAPEVDGGRMTEPADWDEFIMERAWSKAAA